MAQNHVLLTIMLGSCGSSIAMKNIGFSEESLGKQKPIQQSVTTVPTEENSLYAETLRTLVPVTIDAITSGGHNPGRWRGTIFVSPGFEAFYRQVGRAYNQWPEGAAVAEHHEMDNGEKVPSFVMVKTKREPLGWAFLTITAENRIEKFDEQSMCARCHAEAFDDYLFGLRKQASKKSE